MTNLVIKEIKSQQDIVNSCNDKSKKINETRTEAMLERTAWAFTVLKDFKVKGGQEFKSKLLDATNQKTQEETVSCMNRILKNKLIDPEVRATWTPDEDGKKSVRNWMASEGVEIDSWKKIVAFGKDEKALSKLENELVDAMIEVTRQPEFEGIVDQENGEVDKLFAVNTKVILAIRAKVDADNPANSK